MIAAKHHLFARSCSCHFRVIAATHWHPARAELLAAPIAAMSGEKIEVAGQPAFLFGNVSSGRHGPPTIMQWQDDVMPVACPRRPSPALLRSPQVNDPAVVVLQEWWGVTDIIKGHAQKIADQGFRCIVPGAPGGGLQATACMRWEGLGRPTPSTCGASGRGCPSCG